MLPKFSGFRSDTNYTGQPGFKQERIVIFFAGLFRVRAKIAIFFDDGIELKLYARWGFNLNFPRPCLNPMGKFDLS